MGKGAKLFLGGGKIICLLRAQNGTLREFANKDVCGCCKGRFSCWGYRGTVSPWGGAERFFHS